MAVKKGSAHPAIPKGKASYRGLQAVQNGRRFYFAILPIWDLFPYCFVARRDEDPVQGFQRNLAESRADDIARYLQKSGSIPSNIVLSAQPSAHLKWHSRPQSISYARGQKAFLVLDGQHRLWGYKKCKTEHRVPVAIYSGLTRADEARLFIDINTTQKGVPAALLLDIKHVAKMESNREQILREIFDKLQDDSKSPLAGKMSATKSLAGHISRVTFKRAMESAIETGVLLDADEDERYRLILNYLRAFEAELSDKSLLVRSAYFEAIFSVMDEVVRISLARNGNARVESLQAVVRPLAQLPFSAASGRTLPTKKEIAKELQNALRHNIVLTSDML